MLLLCYTFVAFWSLKCSFGGFWVALGWLGGP